MSAAPKHHVGIGRPILEPPAPHFLLPSRDGCYLGVVEGEEVRAVMQHLVRFTVSRPEPSFQERGERLDAGRRRRSSTSRSGSRTLPAPPRPLKMPCVTTCVKNAT